jgi:FkbM family methyltransferase
MGIKESFRNIFEKITGRKIYKILPFGVDPIADITNRFPKYEFKTIFDVGANLGQSAIPFSQAFPNAIIYCFEPVLATYNTLNENLKGYNNVKIFQWAFGSKKEELSIVSNEQSDLNTLKSASTNGNAGAKNVEIIKVDVLADFCTANNIQYINYLKIDTEGFDLEVLKGASGMLNRAAIDFIEVEVGMNKTNSLHVPFEDMKEYLEQHGYFLFGVYEQVQEWKTQQPILRRSNLLFISEKLTRR